MPNILIVETSRGIRNSLRERLEYEKYTVKAAESAPEAFEVMRNFDPDVVLCDHYDIQIPHRPFIVLSDNSSALDDVIAAAHAGASDFISKPIDMNHLLAAIKKAMEPAAGEAKAETEPEREPEEPEREKESAPETPRSRRPTPPTPATDDDSYRELIGLSSGMMHVRNLIERAAPSEARVLITGDNGTGKELVARMLHRKSRRAAAPFVEINCAAIPAELIESELFGHEKGAFTSAVKQHKGKFEQADGGTLFMDEIGDMSLSAQAKVLRALQEGRITPVGSDCDVAVNVRVVAATNKNLRGEISKGTFREDLYHRIGVIIIHVPPLSERTEDIPHLVGHFTERICREYGIAPKSISPECIEEFKRMPWRGNVRELQNVIERLVILGGDCISIDDVRAYVSEFVDFY